MDDEKNNEEKYAIAAVFHDIGIWTDQTIDYLEPSIERAKEHLKEVSKEEWTEEIGLMIDEHHKMSEYKGEYEKTVEVFRRADWIDVSLGMKSFSADKGSIKKIRAEFPNLGFHAFLMKGTIKNFFQHPLNPLPMFKK